MDGLYNYKVQEPLFREYLQELDDEELSREARHHVFLCETSLGGPWEIDVFKTNLIKEVFGRRGRPRRCRESYFELFEALVGFGGVTALVRTPTSRSDHIPKFLLGSAEDRGGKEANCDR